MLDGAEDVLDAHAAQAQNDEAEVQKLHAKIGQLTMENDLRAEFLGRDR